MKENELFSEKVSAGRRTYFFDVKESTDGVKYLVISESRSGRADSFIHSRIMVFEEHIQEFLDGLKKASDLLNRIINQSRIALNKYVKNIRGRMKNGLTMRILDLRMNILKVKELANWFIFFRENQAPFGHG